VGARVSAGLIIAWLTLALLPGVGRAQATRKLDVRVIDSLSGAPIDHAEVTVLPAGGSAPARGATDSTGHFSVGAPANEQLLITVRRLGFTATTIRIAPGVGDDSLAVVLASAAVSLAPTITHATPADRRLGLNGFYERRRTETGTFFDSAKIANRAALDLMSILKPYIKGCTMIFVDGIRMLGVRDVDVRTVIGIEIYHSNTEAPEQFRNPIESMKRCGCIVIWRH